VSFGAVGDDCREEMARTEHRTSETWSSGRAQLALGMVVRIESANGHAWSGQVTSFNDRIVGLRGWTMTDGQFRERDAVTLLVGAGDSLVSVRSQVLSTARSLMRLVRRDAYEESDQRRAPRLRVDLTATVVAHSDREPSPPFETSIADLSCSGCAMSISTTVLLGDRVSVSLQTPSGPLALTGVVVRTWFGDQQALCAGVQFDRLSAPIERLLNRFLVQQLSVGVGGSALDGPTPSGIPT
jgi:PilZ domain